jgi:hypothetical protein
MLLALLTGDKGASIFRTGDFVAITLNTSTAKMMPKESGLPVFAVGAAGKATYREVYCKAAVEEAWTEYTDYLERPLLGHQQAGGSKRKACQGPSSESSGDNSKASKRRK